MLAYFFRRLLLTVPVLFGIATLVFALVHLVPGDPAVSMLGEGATGEDVAALRVAAWTGRAAAGAVRAS